MMMTSPSIPRELSDSVVEDYFDLRDEALNWLAQWCAAPATAGHADAGRKGWSDFNVHDPGVQIVEVVCHALTELAYRARLPVATLLQNPRGVIHWEEGALFAPPDILPMGPLTAADYRKLLLDRFHQIHQVWLFPGITGQHRVWLCLDDVPAEEQAQVRQGAQELLEQQRNLGESFTVLNPPDADCRQSQDSGQGDGQGDGQGGGQGGGQGLGAVLAGLDVEELSRQFALAQQPLMEQPVLVSMAHRQKQGHSLSDILTGPLLRHGSIADESMNSVQDWEQAQAPILEALAKITARGENTAQANSSALAALMQVLKPGGESVKREGDFDTRLPRSAPSTKLLRSPGWKMPRPEPAWQGQDLAEFQPLQMCFPPNYGLGTDELPLAATPLRRAQVQQLRGYLLHFEQLMRNYLAQLGHLPSLFSVRPQQRTYFVQTVYEVPDIMPLLKGYNSEGLKLSRAAERSLKKDYCADAGNPYRRQLATLDESAHVFEQRRHLFLDHLLARFGESFGPPRGATYETIHNKEELLRHLPELGLRRAAAGGAERASGLEERIALLLQRDGALPGVAAHARFYYLVEDGQLSPAEGAEAAAADAFGLTHVLVNWTGNALNPAFKDYVETLIGESSGAHLCHRFLWLEQDAGGPDTVRLAAFLALHEAWRSAGLNAAAGLREWLRQQMETPAAADAS